MLVVCIIMYTLYIDGIGMLCRERMRSIRDTAQSARLHMRVYAGPRLLGAVFCIFVCIITPRLRRGRVIGPVCVCVTVCLSVTTNFENSSHLGKKMA